MEIKVSFIIVTWNSAEHIKNLLDRLPAEEPCETIVVDNASSDQTAALIETSFPQVKIIKNSRNEGLSRATNQAFDVSRGEYLMLLNPDIIIEKEAIEKMLAVMRERPEIGVLGPKLLNPDGSVQPSCREFPTCGNVLFELSLVPRIFKSLSRWKMGYFDHKSSREVDQPIGSCLLVRRDAFIRAGMMDESFPLFYNDVTLCYNIKQLGYMNYFLSEASAVHLHGASTRKVKPKMIIESHHSLYHYMKTHGKSLFLSQLMGLIIFSSAVARVLFYRVLKLFGYNRKNCIVQLF